MQPSIQTGVSQWYMHVQPDCVDALERLLGARVRVRYLPRLRWTTVTNRMILTMAKATRETTMAMTPACWCQAFAWEGTSRGSSTAMSGWGTSSVGPAVGPSKLMIDKPSVCSTGSFGSGTQAFLPRSNTWSGSLHRFRSHEVSCPCLHFPVMSIPSGQDEHGRHT